MPRCRLTRTDPAVRPVRAAISGPVMPSTSRSVNVSRYASGSPRMMAMHGHRFGPILVGRRQGVRQLRGLGRATQVIGRAIARDRRQPPAESGRVAQRCSRCIADEEHVLHEVFGVQARHARQQNAVNHPRVLRVERRKRRAIPPLRGADQLFDAVQGPAIRQGRRAGQHAGTIRMTRGGVGVLTVIRRYEVRGCEGAGRVEPRQARGHPLLQKQQSSVRARASASRPSTPSHLRTFAPSAYPISRRLPLRVEERRRRHDCADAVADGVDRVLDLDARARRGAHGASTVARPIICFSTGDQVDDVMRPTWRPLANTGTATRDAVGSASGGRPHGRRRARSTSGQSTVRPTMRRRGPRALLGCERGAADESRPCRNRPAGRGPSRAASTAATRSAPCAR